MLSRSDGISQVKTKIVQLVCPRALLLLFLCSPLPASPGPASTSLSCLSKGPSSLPRPPPSPHPRSPSSTRTHTTSFNLLDAVRLFYFQLPSGQREKERLEVRGSSRGVTPLRGDLGRGEGGSTSLTGWGLPRWRGVKEFICLPVQEMQETRVQSLGWENSLE